MPVTTHPVVEKWLAFDGSADDHPAGPLFAGGRYAEFEITMTGGGGDPATVGVTGCMYCTGSRCGGYLVECTPI
ncbi:MAG TPA: DUF6229 family protein [Pseudonocardiaceae bacterium]